MFGPNQNSPPLTATTTANFSNFSFGPQTTTSAFDFGTTSAFSGFSNPATPALTTVTTAAFFGGPNIPPSTGFASITSVAPTLRNPLNLTISTGGNGFGEIGPPTPIVRTPDATLSPELNSDEFGAGAFGLQQQQMIPGFQQQPFQPPLSLQQPPTTGIQQQPFQRQLSLQAQPTTGFQQQRPFQPPLSLQQPPTIGFQQRLFRPPLSLQLLQQQQQQQQQLQQQQQQQQLFQQFQQWQLHPDAKLGHAILYVDLFDNENDLTVSNWNRFQAVWGIGKAFYSNTAPPVDIAPDNHFCLFKAIAYNPIPGKDNKLGHVLIMFNKSYDDLINQQQQIIQNLHQIFGNKQNLVVNIEKIQQCDVNKAELTISIDERSLTNPNEERRALATELSSYLNQQRFNMQLKNMNVDFIIPVIRPDDDDLEKYTNTPPPGINEVMWQHAKLHNPDPKLFIPVPIYGFKQLQKRVEMQIQQTEWHELCLIQIGKDIKELKQCNAAHLAKIEKLKRNLTFLDHHLVKIATKQECTRKGNAKAIPEEQVLKHKVEYLEELYYTPISMKGRLRELRACVNLQGHVISVLRNVVPVGLERDNEDNVRSFLNDQQDTINCLIGIIKCDMEILQRIQNEVSTFKLPELQHYHNE